MNYSELAEKARYFKENEKGVAAMCRAMEEMRDATVERTRIEIAVQMIRDGKLSFEQIAQYSMLALEKVKELAVQMSYC